jgi:hypothetical protein
MIAANTLLHDERAASSVRANAIRYILFALQATSVGKLLKSFHEKRAINEPTCPSYKR